MPKDEVAYDQCPLSYPSVVVASEALLIPGGSNQSTIAELSDKVYVVLLSRHLVVVQVVVDSG